MSVRARWLVFVAAAAGLTAAAPAQAQSPPPAGELLGRMHAAYAALRSYADTGTVLTEDQIIGAPMMTERHNFVTRFTAPRRFFFEFTKNPATAAERYVIWSGGETFATWWSATQTVESYPQGEGQNAFALGEFPTLGTALFVPPLLFQGSGLQGPLVDFASPRHAGMETIADRAHYILDADVRLNHWSETTRPTRLWIDAESYLVRKIVQDTPRGLGNGVVQRVTASFAPLAEPVLDAASFTFTPP